VVQPTNQRPRGCAQARILHQRLQRIEGTDPIRLREILAHLILGNRHAQPVE
jgi:hypothetical protein